MDRQRAYRVWVTEMYGDVFGLASKRRPMTARTAREFRAAMRAGRVPTWVLDLAPLGEIRQAGGET